jgi:hypothetical protein
MQMQAHSSRAGLWHSPALDAHVNRCMQVTICAHLCLTDLTGAGHPRSAHVPTLPKPFLLRCTAKTLRFTLEIKPCEHVLQARLMQLAEPACLTVRGLWSPVHPSHIPRQTHCTQTPMYRRLSVLRRYTVHYRRQSTAAYQMPSCGRSISKCSELLNAVKLSPVC